MSTAPPADINTIAVATDNTFLSERAQLEAARLARLKRMRESEQTAEPRPKVKSKPSTSDPFMSSDEDEMQGPPAKRSKLSAYKSHVNHPSSESKKPMLSTAQPKASGSRLAGTKDTKDMETSAESDLFWKGELRQTANMHVDRAKDGRPVFRLHDILGNVSLVLRLLLL